MSEPDLKTRLGTSLVWFALGMIVAAVVGTIAALGWLEGFVDKRVQAATTQGPAGVANIPKGAVVAFDIREGCPSGWQPFSHANGRFIIGASDPATSKLPNDENDERLKHRVFGQDGGTQRHTLTVKEMPKSSGTIVDAELSGTGKLLWDYPIRTGRIFGPAEPHNNMPPYFALHFCIKE